MMMRLCVLPLLLMLAMPVAAAPLPPWSQGYDPARDPAADGREAITLAKASGRYVLIELGGNWCVWCRRLDHFLEANPDLRARLHRQFVLLKVNVSAENDNADFLAGLPRFAGFPHAFVADDKGRIIHSQDTTEWQKNGHYSRIRFRAFLDRWRTNAQATSHR